MSDLIDRRATIDALEKIDCSDGVGISLLKCDAVDDVVTAIKALPSAQPDEEKISDLLYDVYRLTCPQLGTGGVAVLKSYISMIYKKIFGEEGPGWMR